jgi:hypothetical protein
MTRDERVLCYGVPTYRCIFCKTEGLTLGPRGGLSVNVMCPTCEAVFNVISRDAISMYCDRIDFFGQVVREPKAPIAADQPVPQP